MVPSTLPGMIPEHNLVWLQNKDNSFIIRNRSSNIFANTPLILGKMYYKYPRIMFLWILHSHIPSPVTPSLTITSFLFNANNIFPISFSLSFFLGPGIEPRIAYIENLHCIIELFISSLESKFLRLWTPSWPLIIYLLHKVFYIVFTCFLTWTVTSC